MSRNDRLIAILERVVATLWLCAAIGLLLKVVASQEGERSFAANPHVPAALCGDEASWADECPALSSRHLVKNSTDDSALYLVRSAASPGCPFPEDGAVMSEAKSLTELEKQLGARCGLALRHSRVDEDNLCFTLTNDPCGAFFVSAKSVRPCAAVVAGPFDASGAFLTAPVESPFLTVLPSVTLSSLLLDILDLRQTVVGELRHLEGWRGTAYAGWLVLSTRKLRVPSDHRIAAQTALSRIAASVAARPPRPQPVLLDLAGLERCPDSKQLTDMLSEMESIGIRPFGYYPVSADLGPDPIRLASDGRERAMLMSLRIRSLEEDGEGCATLPEIPSGVVVQAIRNRLNQELEPPEFTAVFLHWPSEAPGDSEWETLVREVLELGVSLVVGYSSGNAGPLLVGESGLGVVNAGSAMDDRSILPSALIPSGLAVRCFSVGSGTTCRSIPVAQTMAEPLPVTSRDCRGCGLLPNRFFDRLSHGRQCVNGKLSAAEGGSSTSQE